MMRSAPLHAGPSATADTILSARGVTRRFGDTLAVNRVSLELNRGEFVTLLGPSGCGKTTLMRMIAGFETTNEGRIEIEGQDVTALPPYRRPLGMMFQSLALFPHMSVFDNVAFGLRVRRQTQAEIRRQVEEGLALVGLSAYVDRSVHQLSGGQRQRVALARALVVRPSVLCLDEPFSALDLKLRRQMQQEVKALQRQLGITFLFVTHDQEEALSMSDRIAVMNGGHIEQIGPAREVYDRPRTAFVAQFVGDTNFVPAEVRGGRLVLPGFGPDRAAPAGAPDRTGVALSVRPEAIRLSPGAAGPLTGRIAATTYFGSTVRYEIAVLDRVLLASGACLPGQGPAFGDGDPVSIDWPDGSGVIVDTSEGADNSGEP